MTVIYDPKDIVYSNPQWNNRGVQGYSIFVHEGRDIKGQEFTIEKNQYGVEIEFQTDRGDFSRGFTHEEFEEFIRQCQWISQCKVEQKK